MNPNLYKQVKVTNIPKMTNTSKVTKSIKVIGSKWDNFKKWCMINDTKIEDQLDLFLDGIPEVRK